MAFFKVTAERSHGLVGKHNQGRNPFLIGDIFDPNLRVRVERRVWERMEAKDEAEVRAFFAQGQRDNLEAVRGFTLLSIEPLNVAEGPQP